LQRPWLARHLRPERLRAFALVARWRGMGAEPMGSRAAGGVAADAPERLVGAIRLAGATMGANGGLVSFAHRRNHRDDHPE